MKKLYMFFFFKQKTAYDLRISDWSSDVCSSDLSRSAGARGREKIAVRFRRPGKPRPSRRARTGAPQGEVFLMKQYSRPHAEEARRAVSKHEAGPKTCSKAVQRRRASPR